MLPTTRRGAFVNRCFLTTVAPPFPFPWVQRCKRPWKPSYRVWCMVVNAALLSIPRWSLPTTAACLLSGCRRPPPLFCSKLISTVTAHFFPLRPNPRMSKNPTLGSPLHEIIARINVASERGAGSSTTYTTHSCLHEPDCFSVA